MVNRTWLVQRWWVVVTRGPDGVMHRHTQTAADVNDSLPSAAMNYRRALDGLWAHPTWEDWGVTADAEVVALADCEPKRVPCPPEVRASIGHLAARLGPQGGMVAPQPPQEAGESRAAGPCTDPEADNG